jgi:hypothetical protein
MFQPVSGFANMTQVYGMPIFISRPNMLYASPSAVDKVVGMQPNAAKNDIMFDVEPVTGKGMFKTIFAVLLFSLSVLTAKLLMVYSDTRLLPLATKLVHFIILERFNRNSNGKRHTHTHTRERESCLFCTLAHNVCNHCRIHSIHCCGLKACLRSRRIWLSQSVRISTFHLVFGRTPFGYVISLSTLVCLPVSSDSWNLA